MFASHSLQDVEKDLLSRLLHGRPPLLLACLSSLAGGERQGARLGVGGLGHHLGVRLRPLGQIGGGQLAKPGRGAVQLCVCGGN